MMNCRESQILIARRLRDGIAVEEESLLAGHLQRCTICRTGSEAMSILAARIAERRSDPGLQGIRKPSLEGISERLGRRSVRHPILLPAMCTVCFVLLALVVLLQPDKPNHG